MAEMRRIARAAPGRRRWLDWLAGAMLALVLHGAFLMWLPLPRMDLTRSPAPDASRAARIEVRLLPPSVVPVTTSEAPAMVRELSPRSRIPVREPSRRPAEAPAMHAVEPAPADAEPAGRAPPVPGLPGDYRSSGSPSTQSAAERANKRLQNGGGREAESDLGRGIASAARADCLKPRDDGSLRLGGLLGLPGLAIDAATGKCRL